MKTSSQRGRTHRFAALVVLAPTLFILSGCVVAETPRVHRTVYVEPAPAVVGPTAGIRLSFVAQPPPAPRREVIVVRDRPSPDHVWVNGYWVWRESRHVWVAGHWEHPPRPHAVWVEPRWEHRHEGYVFIAGTWR